MKQIISFYHLPGLNAFLRKRQFPWKSALFMVLAGIVTLGVTLIHTPAHAYDVAIDPTSPHQGDTVSILVTGRTGASQPPTVTVNGESYPTFAIGRDRYRVLVPTSPLSASGRYVVQVTGPEDTRNPAFWLSRRSFPTQRITLPANRRSRGTDHEFERVAAFRQVMTPEKYWMTPMERPSPGRVSAGYGIRRFYNGVFAENYFHRGVDYAAPVGTPIVAPAAGRVVLVGRVADGFEIHGNTVGIDHGQGVGSIFIHLNTIGVREGDMVQAGQTVGTIGTTGASTGPHLHWGLYVNGVAVDPGPWLSRRMD